MSSPSVAELKAVIQPPSVMKRANAEHWAGTLYMRDVSPYLTRWLVRTPITANGVTWLMIASGLLAAAVLTLPGWVAGLGAFLLIQLQLLLDCSDGEVARWRQTSSPAGVYLDRIGHYSTEACLPAALGVHADGGFGHIGGWTTLGLVVSVLVLMTKSETDLVHVARAFARLPLLEDSATTKAPRRQGLGALRSLVRFVPFYRAFVAVEFTILALVATVADTVLDDHLGTRTMIVFLLGALAVTAAGHLAAVMASSRLR